MKNKAKIKKYFLLSWKKVLLVVVLWFVSVVLHNLFYALAGVEEALFFIIAVFLIPAYVAAASLYTTFFRIIKK